MKVAKAISIRWADSEDLGNRRLAAALRRDGTDLTKAVISSLSRGTPLYVESSADVIEVQLRMARAQCGMLPVLERGVVVGLIDLEDLSAIGSRRGGTLRRIS